MAEAFGRISRQVAQWTGSPTAFVAAILIILLWALMGPVFGFSDTWQLVVNTATTIVTFLMVFLIQNTQNRDSMALQLKLDELIHAASGARDEMIDLEEEPQARLQHERERFRRVASELSEVSADAGSAAQVVRQALDAEVPSTSPRPPGEASDP